MRASTGERLAALARRLRARGRGEGGPLLTVIVPIYGVEQYLPRCLASVRAQPVYQQGRVEVVLVDDGSPDRAGQIADEFAAAEPAGRVRVLHQRNAGLGAARNAGVPFVRTPYLTFLDSDDTLPEDAWGRMLEVIEDTGSDLVIGKAVRILGDRVVMGRWMRVNHREDAFGITVSERPEMLAEVMAVNKLYRRSFWEDAGVSFPEGVLHEDQPALTRALLSARAFDVLTDVVYHWEVREDGSSITQNTHDLANLRDRIATKRQARAMVRAHAREKQVPHVLQAFTRQVLAVDMWLYFRSAAEGDETYWRELRDAVLDLWSDIPFHHCEVPVQQRLMGWLVAQDRREDLVRFLRWFDETPPAGRIRDGELQHPLRDEPGVPVEVVRAAAPAIAR
jgi:CDP-glycerol glycerophosphotransferase